MKNFDTSRVLAGLGGASVLAISVVLTSGVTPTAAAAEECLLDTGVGDTDFGLGTVVNEGNVVGAYDA